MTLLPNWKICKKCGNRWDYNPSINQIRCPYCTEKTLEKAKKISNIISTKNKNNERHQ